MEMESGMSSKPAQDHRVLVGAVVVSDQVNLLVRRGLPIDSLEDLQPLLVEVSRHAAADNLTVQRTQSCEQGRGAIAFVVVSHRATTALLDRQARLGPIESLDLALLIGAQDESVLWWVEIECNDIFHLLDETPIVTELEGPNAMRLEAMAPPHPTNRRGADSDGLGHAPRAPMSGILRRLLRGLANDLHYQVLGQGRQTPRPWSIPLDSAQSNLTEAAAPTTARVPHDAQTRRNLSVLLALGGQQHDLGALGPARRRTAASAIGLQPPLLLSRNPNQRRDSHPLILPQEDTCVSLIRFTISGALQCSASSRWNLIQAEACSLDLLEDVGSLGGPDVWLG